MTTLDLSRQELMARLREHKTLMGVPESELEWLIDHGQPRMFALGEDPLPPDLSVDEMFIVFSGHMSIYVDRGAGSRRTMDWYAGDIAGLLPYSRMKKAPAMTHVEEAAFVLAVHRSQLGELTRECPEVTARCVQSMLDRARIFTQHDEQDEKMVSLGRLSAGLAHELDNPASAVMRGAKVLTTLIEDADHAAVALGQSNISSEELSSIEKLRNQCVNVRAQHVRSPLEQARHEEAISDWLDDHGVRIASSEALAETTITVGMLDDLERRIDADILEPALRWIAAGCAVRTIVAETGEAASRMSELVKAVRAFTHRDEARTPQPVDVQQGLTETLAVLRSKAKEKAIRVRIEAPPDLPKVEAVGGELNQVWSNLIDNALYAAPKGGTVDVIAKQAGNDVVVSIIDNGPGVPPENRERIFDPFFTTKPVGEGTGQGLDIVRRLVIRRRGKLDLFSTPGHTEFRVTLPAVSGAPDGATKATPTDDSQGAPKPEREVPA